MGDIDLPIPSQLEAQLAKCRTMRELDFYKPRTKTATVRNVFPKLAIPNNSLLARS